MERIEQNRDKQLIDLGSVVEETKGGGISGNDGAGAEQLFPGLADD